MVGLHKRVFASGLPSYKGLRIPFDLKLNILQWRYSLKDYPDTVIVDYLELGWPVGYHYGQYCFQLVNYAIIRELSIIYMSQTLISRQRWQDSVAGPFLFPPFSGHMGVSPLNSVPKKDLTERHVILDLSWSLNMSFKTGIEKSLHEGMEFDLQYPTVDHIASLIAHKGTGCLLYKCHLREAYRQFYIDPFNFPLLGFHRNNYYYFDVVLSTHYERYFIHLFC